MERLSKVGFIALGLGHAMKALNNLVSAAGLIAAAEALLIGRRFGLDPTAMIDVLNASTGRNNSTKNLEVPSGNYERGKTICSSSRNGPCWYSLC